MNSKDLSYGTAAQQSGAAEATPSSQTIANAPVGSSTFKQRPLKFRAWDDGKMVYPTGALSDIKRFFRIIREDAPLMQFTGQTDSNKKEIYEYDIIRLEYYPDLPSTQGIELVKLLVVRYCPMHTHFSAVPIKCTGSYSVGFSGSAVKSYEVVGNTFENPELLGW